ncbi:MAG: hypothetical protein V3575_04420, partial [Candidatus Absconditabacteria bacterium]
MNGIFCMIVQVLLYISLFVNAALYFGWIDVGQFRTYVNVYTNEALNQTNKIYQDSALNELVESHKTMIEEKYQVDLDDISGSIAKLSESKAKEYIKSNFTGVDDKKVDEIFDFIKNMEIVEKSADSSNQEQTTSTLLSTVSSPPTKYQRAMA